jgi:acyl carrier protein
MRRLLIAIRHKTIDAKSEARMKRADYGIRAVNGLTPRGARKALPSRAQYRAMSDTASNHIRIEKIVAALLARRGNLAPPSVTQNLREAGLTSLDMVNLMLAVEAEFDIEIPQSAMTPANFDTIAAIDSLVTLTAQAA